MTPNRARIGIVVGALLVLTVVNSLVLQRERTLRDGTLLFVELAPRDPRSLIQGDYMALRYVLPDSFAADSTLPRLGTAVVRLDTAGVARVVRPWAGEALGEAEHLLGYHRSRGQLWLGADAFFFQEGHAHYYEPARYGALRVDAAGNSILVGLRDEALNPLGPPLRR